MANNDPAKSDKDKRQYIALEQRGRTKATDEASQKLMSEAADDETGQQLMEQEETGQGGRGDSLEDEFDLEFWVQVGRNS